MGEWKATKEASSTARMTVAEQWRLRRTLRKRKSHQRDRMTALVNIIPAAEVQNYLVAASDYGALPSEHIAQRP